MCGNVKSDKYTMSRNLGNLRINDLWQACEKNYAMNTRLFQFLNNLSVFASYVLFVCTWSMQ